MTTIENEALERYEPLVRSIARKTITSSNVSGLDDLYQAGRMAVANAVRTYRPSKGASLNTHVHRLVRQAIYEEAGKFCGPFAISDKTMKLASKASRMSDEGISDYDIGESCGRSAEAISILRSMYDNRHEAAVQSNDVAVFTPDFDLVEFLNGIKFSNKERFIFTKRYMEGETISNIAQTLRLHIQAVHGLDKAIRDKVMKEIWND